MSVCRKAPPPLPDRIRSQARIHLPGMGAVVLVSTIATCAHVAKPVDVEVLLHAVARLIEAE